MFHLDWFRTCFYLKEFDVLKVIHRVDEMPKYNYLEISGDFNLEVDTSWYHLKILKIGFLDSISIENPNVSHSVHHCAGYDSSFSCDSFLQFVGSNGWVGNCLTRDSDDSNFKNESLGQRTLAGWCWFLLDALDPIDYHFRGCFDCKWADWYQLSSTSCHHAASYWLVE